MMPAPPREDRRRRHHRQSSSGSFQRPTRSYVGVSRGRLQGVALLVGEDGREDQDHHELSSVSIDGRTLPHSHAKLVQTPRGWHVELDDEKWPGEIGQPDR